MTFADITSLSLSLLSLSLPPSLPLSLPFSLSFLSPAPQHSLLPFSENAFCRPSLFLSLTFSLSLSLLPPPLSLYMPLSIHVERERERECVCVCKRHARAHTRTIQLTPQRIRFPRIHPRPPRSQHVEGRRAQPSTAPGCRPYRGCATRPHGARQQNAPP